MDNLEKLMKENKAMFQEVEPDFGHFERFEKKLERMNRRGRVIQLSARISKIAAIAVLGIMSSLWVYNQFSDSQPQSIKLGEVSADMQEVEFFYTSQIDTYCTSLKANDLIKDTEYEKTMTDELKQMDSVYIQLQRELGANPNDERIIRAMIRHYQTKLEVLKEILNKLNQFQEMNDSNSNNQNQYESVTL